MTDLRITFPCAAKWNEMTPVAGGRHCDSCAKTVIDLTCLAPVQHDAALRRVQAEIRQGHHFCLRALTTRDGRILSSSRRILTGGMAAMLAVTLAGCHGTDTGPNHVSTNPAATSAGSKSAAPATHQIQGEIEEIPTIGKPFIQPVAMGLVALPPPTPQVKEDPIPAPVAPHASE